MNIDKIENKVIFRSGYPTFGTSGHLNLKPSVVICLSECFKPKPNTLLKEGRKIDYLA